MLAENNQCVRSYEPLTAMQPHLHDEATLTVILGGDYVESIGKSRRHYGAGLAAFCPAGVLHAQEFGPAGARQIILKPQQEWLEWLSEHLDLAGAPCSRSAELRQLGTRLLHELSNRDEFSNIAREGLALEILATFARIAETRVAKPPIWLRAARDFIHAHAFESLSVARIAHVAGRHEIHLAREFRRYFGTSIGAYLRRLRTEEAARLLSQTQDDITDIALRCGFASHAHLCRVFRTHYGATPSHHRALHSS